MSHTAFPFGEPSDWDAAGAQATGVRQPPSEPQLAQETTTSEGAAKSKDDKPKLKGTVDLLDAVQITHNTSPDKLAATVLFRNLVASVGGAKGLPLVEKRVVSLEFGVDGSGQEVTVPHILRGFVSKTAQANPVLLVQAAGQTTLVDLSRFGTEKTELLHTWDVKVPASGTYHITLALLADRLSDDPEVGCYLGIDSLDLDFAKAINCKG